MHPTPRRSPRNALVSGGALVGESVATAVPGTRKRKSPVLNDAKEGLARKRQKKGALAALLTNFPLEVIFEISSYLFPQDLLHLVQSSKVFAVPLLSKAQEHIWKSARLLEDNLPNCPEDLTEQQFAGLLLGTGCQRCGVAKLGVDRFCWGLRRRWCQLCLSKVTAGKDTTFILNNESPELLICSAYMNTNAGRRFPRVHVARADEVAKVKQELEQLRKSEDKEAEEQYHTNRRRLTRTHTTETNALNSWWSHRVVHRSNDLQKLRNLRLSDLKERLVESGFHPLAINAIRDYAWSTFPTMKQSKRLTAKAWETLQPTFKPLVKDAIADLERLGVRWARDVFLRKVETMFGTSLPSMEYFPLPELFLLRQPEIETSISKWACKPENGFMRTSRWPEDPQLPQRLYDLVTSQLETVRQEYMAYFRNSFVTSGRVPIVKHDSTTPNMHLDLAIALFKAPLSKRSSKKSKEFVGPFGIPYQETSRISSIINRAAVEGPIDQSWVFDSDSSILIEKIIRASGLDPATCTHHELEELDPFVVCGACALHEGALPIQEAAIPVMNWIAVPTHWGQHHASQLGVASSIWSVLAPEQRSLLLHDRGSGQGVSCCKANMNGAIYLHEDVGCQQYRCLMCLGSSYHLGPYRLDQLKSHIRLSHGDVPENDREDPKYRMRSRLLVDEATRTVLWTPTSDIKAQYLRTP